MKFGATMLLVIITVSLAHADVWKINAKGQKSVWAVDTTTADSGPNKTDYKGSDDALDEVNAYRAKRGLAPFKRDALLTQAAATAAKKRASRSIAGHLPESDFSCLPPGAHADAAGCGALEDSWGWGTCCMDENYAYAGAAWVRGNDGKRYMHLFVRHEAAATKEHSATYTGDSVFSTGTCSVAGTCSSGQCSIGTTVRQYGGLLSRGRRGR